MKLTKLYTDTIGVFGMSQDATGRVIVALPEQEPFPVKLNGKELYIPTSERVEKSGTKEWLLYHPALEDVLKKPSAVLQLTAKTAGYYWSALVLPLVAALAHLCHDEELLEAQSAETKAYVLDVLKLPVMTNADVQHITNWATAMMESSEVAADYAVSFTLRDVREGESGLRVCTLFSQALVDVIENDKDGLGSINGFKMSKKSIGHLAALLKHILPFGVTGTSEVNRFTACPSYEVLWSCGEKMATHFQPFAELLGEHWDLSYSLMGELQKSTRSIAATIAVVTVSEGNRPMVPKRRAGIDMKAATTESDPPPWDTTPAAAPPRQAPPPDTQYAAVPPQPVWDSRTNTWIMPQAMPPQQPAPAPHGARADGCSDLPAWMNPQPYAPQQQYAPQQYPTQQQYAPPMSNQRHWADVPQQQTWNGMTAAPPQQQPYTPYVSPGYVGASAPQQQPQYGTVPWFTG